MTSSLTDAITAIRNGREPALELISAGHLEIGLGGYGNEIGIENGTFTAITSDPADRLEALRLRVTEERPDPCVSERLRAKLSRSELHNAQREGLSAQAIRGLINEDRESQRELEECVRRHPTELDRELFVFRSRNLYRTGSADLDDVRIYVLILDAEDWELLGTQGGLSNELTYADIGEQIRKELPTGAKVGTISVDSSDSVRINFSVTKEKLNVATTIHGHLIARLRAFQDYDYRKFVDITRVTVDLHGVKGWFADRFVSAEQITDDALASYSYALNNRLAGSVDQLQETLSAVSRAELQATLTLLSIEMLADRIRFSAAIGVLLGVDPDPCQNLRDLVQADQRELANAAREGLSSQQISAARNVLKQRLQELNNCRISHM